MKIGEFAEICGVNISVLRHYDREGLIIPDYIDRFTGYRYYSAEKIDVFKKVSALKNSGFTLAEIRDILSAAGNGQVVLDLINRRETELYKMLTNLKEVKIIMSGNENRTKPLLFNTGSGEYLQLSIKNPIDIQELRKAQKALDLSVKELDYQRISNFKTLKNGESDLLIYIRVDVIKLSSDMIKLREDTNIPFENDSDAVGMWEIIGEFADRDDFEMEIEKKESIFGDKIKHIYFLPNGLGYWIFGGWSKGYLINLNGDYTAVNKYITEIIGGIRYMFVEWKSYEYLRGGRPTVLVLRQSDNNAYSKDEITRSDVISLPFVGDSAVIGKWDSVAYCGSKDNFIPAKPDSGIFFKSIIFCENGLCENVFRDKTIKSPSVSWTKGFVLYKNDRTACAYEFKEINGTEYLFIEWKSGDWIWGGWDPIYNVFTREEKHI